MKMKSISGLVHFVKDLDKTAQFYEKLGFVFATRTEEFLKGYLNWFWIEFVLEDKAEESIFQKALDKAAQNKGNLFVHISVEKVDEAYEEMLKKGLKPESKPQDFSWGRREFILRDPDGYKLVFFEKK